MLSIFGLLPLGLTSNQASIEQAVAVNISSAIVSDLRTAQMGLTGTSPRFGIVIPIPQGSAPQTTGTSIFLASDGSASPTGSVVTSGSSVSRYRATIGFYPPLANQRTATTVRVLITWPAMADPKPGTWPSWPTNYTGSYEADTALDRN